MFVDQFVKDFINIVTRTKTVSAFDKMLTFFTVLKNYSRRLKSCTWFNSYLLLKYKSLLSYCHRGIKTSISQMMNLSDGYLKKKEEKKKQQSKL